MPVKRGQVVRHRRARAAQPKGQARDLASAPIDPVSLERKVYLSVREFAIYGNFQSENAARLFLSRHRDAVPTLHRGRVAQVARRDFDRYLQASTARQHGVTIPSHSLPAERHTWSR